MSALRTFAAAAVSALCASQAYPSTLIISEVLDGTEVVESSVTGRQPKYVELTNTGPTTVDLSGFSIAIFNDGSPTFNSLNGQSGMLASGDSYVAAFELDDSPVAGTFLDLYGFSADSFNFGNLIDGNDVIALYEGPAITLLDVFGVIGQDGSGEVWEYTDGYAVRNPDVTVANSVFTPSEWFFSGPGNLESGNSTLNSELIRSRTTPGTHDFGIAAVPLPATVLLLGFAVLGLGALRRHA